MIYPLKSWLTLKNGYVFGQKTSYNQFHRGIDKGCPIWTEVYAPTDGEIKVVSVGTEGGRTIHFLDSNGKLWRFMHLVKNQNKGKYKQGELIANTGNSGTLTTGAHLHTDISKNGKLELNNLKNFIDPEIYIKFNMTNFKPNSIVFSKADAEYYWVKSNGELLAIKHDRLIQAAMMAQSTPTEESLKNKTVGNF